MKLRISGLLFLFLTVSLLAQEPGIRISPNLNVKLPRLAVADFVARVSANQETDSALKVFNQVLWNDLEFSSFFDMPSKSFYPLKPLRFPRDVEFENWQVPSLDADFLILGNLQVDSGTVITEAYLYDVKTRQPILGKRYTVTDTKLVRRVAHQFADQVVYQLSAGASRGVAQTRIAYTSKKGDAKEVYVMDYDGMNSRTITANGGINKFPAWSPDNSKLAFITKLPNAARWQLWIQDLTGGGRRVIRTPTSYVSSPAFSPDGTRIAFAARSVHSSASDVFVAAADGSGMRNLTSDAAIDTAPTWSPTSQQIAFISDRSGTPQVWVMDADGSNLRRLVKEGGHCDSPSWSPNGRFVVYSWQAPHQYTNDIFVVEVASGKIFQLTSGRADNESPSWSADSRHIVFQSNRSGTKQIFIMNIDGKDLKQVSAYGINDSPAWSMYVPGEQPENK